MNTKIVALLAVVVVVVAGIGIACVALDNKKDSEPTSDYKLLDSTDNIKKGLTLVIDFKTGEGTATTKQVVDSVENDTVKSSVTGTLKNAYIKELMSLSTFVPTDWYFDYTGEAPENIKIDVNDNVYTINGTYTYDLISVTFENLKITWDGENVTNVTGGIKYDIKTDDASFKTDFTLTTKDNLLLITGSLSMELSFKISDFFEDSLDAWDPSNYGDIAKSQGTVKFGNVDAENYLVDGTCADGTVYENAKKYIYGGYEVYTEGKMNGLNTTVKLSIYIA